jgi:hypothetical protein
MIWLLPRLWRYLRGFMGRIARWFGRATSPAKAESRGPADV